MADPNPDNNNPGEGTPDDFTQWDWHKIMTAIVGYYGSNSNSGLSDPSTLYTAANTLEYVKNTLAMVSKSIQDQADALSYGDDAPWKGAAAGAFNQMMYALSQNIHANAQVLVGDVAADEIPNQIYTNGQRLETAINTIHAIDHWYASQAIARGVPVKDGLVMVHEDQQIVDALNRDMRTVITNLSSHYQVTNDGFTPPNTTDPNGPNDTGDAPPPPPPPPDNPFGDGNNPFGDGGTGGDDGSGGGGSDFNPPPVTDFNPPPDSSGGDGLGGDGGTGGSDFNPPPVSDFPGGADGLGGDGLGGDGLGGDSGLGGADGLGGANDLSNFSPPPVSDFPGGTDGLGGADGGLGGTDGGSAFVPPPVTGFPGLGTSGGLNNSGLDSNLGTSGLDNSSDLFNDTGGLDTSGLDKPGVSAFPGLGDALGGVGGGADGLGDGGAGGLGDLGSNLESNAPGLQDFPGLSDTGLGGANGGLGEQNLGSGAPMMPPGMGGMGGAGNQNTPPPKSDASGLLNPTPFPGDLGDGAFDPSGLLTGGPGAQSGLGGGLSGLDGLDGLSDLGGGAGGGTGADLPPVAGFPGSTDVSDPSLSGLGPDGLGDVGSGGLSTEGLGGSQQQAGGGVPGSPMMPPGMGGMGGAGNQNTPPPKSDASGLLSPTAFPGGLADNLGDPSVLLSGGAGAEGGAGGLSGLDSMPSVPVFDAETPVTQPEGTSVDNPVLPAEEATATTPAAPGQQMPMMPPGMGGMGGAGNQNTPPPKSDASGLLNPIEFPGGVVDNGGDPSGLITGGVGTPGGAGGLSEDATVLPVQEQQPAEPIVVPPVVPTVPPGTPGGEKSEASRLLAAGAFPESGFTEQQHGIPGGTNHNAVQNEPVTPPDRVAMVQGEDAVEDFTAWDAGGAASVAVLPWLLGRGGKDDERDLQTDAPVEDNDKWAQGDLRGVPAPADGPQLSTWRPEKVVTAPGQPAEEVVFRSSGAMPEPQPEPEPEPAAAEDGEEGEPEPERTSADLLDRRSEQWDKGSSDLPGVLG
ncbi:hypothetical protein [Kutzneria sp. NPDC052558]|uniref:hypothetical protein n=1 Tax=Kutzneria sp. NPDC052558 TaxID=3364121 RepID=UPI0037CCBE00